MTLETPCATDAVEPVGPALDDWLRGHAPGYSGPATLNKFQGGQSNPTFRIAAASGRYVLRRKPFGPLLPSAHAVDREFRLLTALHPLGFPVPAPIALCTDPHVLGVDFYVMELIEGRCLADGALPQCTRAERTAIYGTLIDSLARLHTIEPSAAGLADYGRPGNYFERQVRRWTRQYRDSQTETLQDVERLIDWLPRTLPVQDRVAIVHGDYRIDNLIFAPAEPRILAVIDWELSTLGDPLADFSYLLMNWRTPHDGGAGIAGLDLERLGIPSLEEAVHRYCRATGRDGLPDLNWYFAYNLFRLVAIVQGIAKRVIEGNASNRQAAAMVQRIRPLAAQAWACAMRAGAT